MTVWHYSNVVSSSETFQMLFWLGILALRLLP